MQDSVLFWPAYRSKGGLGNVMRCLTLASHLQRRFQSTFCLPRSFPALKTIASIEFNCTDRQDLPSQNHKYDLVLLDDQDPEEAADNAKFVREILGGCPIVALDYTGKADTAINCYINLRNYDPAIHQHLKGAKYFEGLRFAIIRDSFRPLRPVEVGNIEVVNNVLITFGGEDSAGWTLATLLWLENNIIQPLNITLTIGALNKKRDDIITAVNSGMHHKYEVFDHLVDIERRMIRCDLAFCSAGTTLMEFAFLGKPIVALPQNDMERSFLALFEQKGYVTSNFLTPDNALNSDAIRELFYNRDLRRASARSGMRIIDGNGCRRIVEILDNLMQQPSAYATGGN